MKNVNDLKQEREDICKKLELNPTDTALQQQLHDLGPPRDPKIIMKSKFQHIKDLAASHPTLSLEFSDPSFQEMLEAFQTNPGLAMKRYARDNRAMQLLLLAIGVDETAGTSLPLSKISAKYHSKPPPRQPQDDSKEDQQSLELKAQKAKDLGNQEYKQRNFGVAVHYYNEAITYHPSNITYYLNKAACLIEMGNAVKTPNDPIPASIWVTEKCTLDENGKERTMPPGSGIYPRTARSEAGPQDPLQLRKNEFYDAAIFSTEEGLCRSKQSNPSPEMIAKAWFRIGTAQMKKGQFALAKKSLLRSRDECETEDIIKKLKEIDGMLPPADRKEQEEQERSEKARLDGNKLFMQGDFEEALKLYTVALQHNSKDARLFSNRAACYIKLRKWNQAIEECECAIRLDPTFMKPYLRKASCHEQAKNIQEAFATLDAALKIDPNNPDVTLACHDTYKRHHSSQVNAFIDEDLSSTMKEVLRDVRKESTSSQKYFDASHIVETLEALLQTGASKT
ncbi:putative Stress-induced-phosphoprotein [Blattamonas nauphoetae]|uniref:Stress-induced-phosphoprotein n=1 Tax=Blattamonas nauphoetae TaxID=2049346 RepID=A0ABQ9WYP5_9EUKA|nr:putative Stress-induced-phosphoprotein [Blattamonas nauphoetae]